MIKRICLLPLVLCLSLTAFAQTRDEPRQLTPGQPIERELAGGESHNYQINLAAGRFVRFRLYQQAIDAVLVLTAPDGKPPLEVNLTGAGEQETLSLEATAGVYRLTIRGDGTPAIRGSYRLETIVQETATAQDRKRMAAEAVLLETTDLRKQAGKTSKQVIEKVQQVLPVWRELGEPRWIAHSLSLLGYAYYDLGQTAQAIDYWQQALAIYRTAKLRAGEGVALNNLGRSTFIVGTVAAAMEYYEQALAIAREVKNVRGEAIALNNMAGIYRRLGRLDKAIETWEQALATYRRAGNRRGESAPLNGLATASLAQGRYEKAIEYANQSLAVSRELKERPNEVLALMNMGLAYQSLGSFDTSIGYLEQALATGREINDRRLEGVALYMVGHTYYALGRNEKAIEMLERALSVSREVKNRTGEGNALLSLGHIHRTLEHFDKAIEYYEQALAVHREVQQRAEEGRTLQSLGYVYQALGRYEKAIEYAEQALAIARETKEREIETSTLNELGTAYRSLGRLAEAVSYDERALVIARDIKRRGNEAEALHGLMLDWKERGRPALAVYFGKQAVNTYQEIRNNIRAFDAETQRSYLKLKEQAYRNLADLLISQGRLPEAEQVIRMLKEEEYFEYIRRDSTNAPQGQKAQLTPEEAALEKREREIADQLAALGAERGTLMDKKSRTPEEEQRLAKLDADLVVAGNAFQKFLDQLTTELGSSAESGGKVFQLRESQGLMEDLRELGKGTVALYTLVGEDKYRVILTTADFQRGYEYPIKAAALNRKVLEFRAALQNPKFDPLPSAQELYKILLGPVARDLAKAKAKTVMWSLDGVLRYVPVSALHDGKQYLVEQYQNVVFTPASQARLKDAPARNWNALGLGVSKAHGERIPALPGVIDEMRGIIREESPNGTGTQPGVLPGVVELDEQFTQETMLTQLRQRPKVVHIASHFQFSPGNETNSALLLGDGTFLSLAQIKTLPNIFGGVDLLTLSACNTATGGSGANGKEVEGFGVLAQRQGAKAVVASLWPVADRSTKLLMQEFYRSREARNGESKIAALREAQLKLLRGEITVDATQSPSRQITHEDAKPEDAKRPLFKLDPKAPFAHPYYWAPFILIGIELRKRGNAVTLWS